MHSQCPRARCTLGILHCALGNRAPNRSWLHYYMFRAQIISSQWNSVNWELSVPRGRKDFCKYNCLQYLLPVSQTFCVLQGVSAETWGSETLARLKGDSGKGCLIKFDIWLFRKLMFEVPGWLVLLENIITVKDTPVKLNVSMKMQLPGNDYMCNIHFMCCFTSGICTSTHDAWSGT